MKLKLTASIAAAILMVLCFTACKKESVTTTTKATTTASSDQAIAIRLAVNFYKSVTGAYGGADLKNGLNVKAPVSSTSKPSVLASINPLCGMVIDTTTDNTIKHDTTSYRYAGTFAFTYTCSTNSVDGYKNDNTFFTSTKTTNTVDSIYVEEHYTVKALDNTYKLVSLNGSDNISEHNQIFNGPFYKFGTVTINTDYWGSYAQYKLTNIKVDASNGIPDMIDGKALLTYTFYQFDINHQNFDGFTTTYATITFLGDYIARVDIGIPILPPTSSYKVNMLTGQIVN